GASDGASPYADATTRTSWPLTVSCLASSSVMCRPALVRGRKKLLTRAIRIDVRGDAGSRGEGRAAEFHCLGREPMWGIERRELFRGVGIPPCQIEEVRELAGERLARRCEAGNADDRLLPVPPPAPPPAPPP